MRIPNISLRLALLSACAAGHAAADNLTLAGGEARLSGTVRWINAQGVVELASELSPEPLLLKSGSVEKIEFSNKTPAGETPSTLVELSNGDLLPAIIESLNEDKLAVVSPVAGRLEIPRHRVKSLQLGIQRRKVIYQGPHSLEEWSDGGGDMKNWIFARDALVSKGPAVASKKLPLSRQFILRFTFVWKQGVFPNFQIYFADPLVAKGEPCNRYCLDLDGGRVTIKREAAKEKRHHTIAIPNAHPQRFPDCRMQMTIMVNRDTARLRLMINGESMGEFADPIKDVPDGSGITFASTVSSVQEIREIEILEYDDSRERHRNEERGDSANDSLISREDDRWTGRLIEIRNTKDGARFVFKTGFQEKPVEIPEADVSTVFLSGGASKATDDKRPPFVLRLPGEGSLGVSSCEFTGDSASAVHPLLGPLTFRRDGILSIERGGVRSRNQSKAMNASQQILSCCLALAAVASADAPKSVVMNP